MGVLLDSWLLELTLVTGGLFLAIYWYLTSKFDYWKSKGVPYLEPTPLVGNMKDSFLMRRCQHEVFNDIYQRFEGDRYCGLYQFKQPELMVRDPDLVKNVLVKDFSNFQDRLKNIDLTHNRIFESLFVLGAPKWRPLRVVLSPTFTSGKLKAMFGNLARCAEKLNVSLETSADKSGVLDIKELSSNFTTDVIGTCTFGLQVDSVINPHNKFREFGRKMVSLSPLQMLSCFLLFFIPYLGRILRVKIIDVKSADFFYKVVMDAIDHRQKNNIRINDFLQLLMELKEKGKVEFEKDLSKEDSYLKNHLTEDPGNKEEDALEITDELLLAQCLIFFTAGFETSSWTMSFCLHELAVNPDIQQRLREEIDKVLQDHGGELTYDAVQSMTYLGMVVDETLRKYPVVGFLTRECTSDYPVPDSNLVLKRGTTVIIPVYSLHHDPKYFPEPERFDPERFTEQNKRRRPHYCYLPFGEGPRICIGMRLGLLQTKAGLASLLSKYEFSLSEKSEVPLRFNPTGGFFFKSAWNIFERISQEALIH